MGGEIIVFISLFLVVFGICYLYFTTRNKERLALIEKGAEASIFVKGKGTTPFWKVLIVNLALLLMGIGLAIFIASFLDNTLGLDAEVAYPGTIFLMAGLGLYAGFTLTKKLEKEV